MRPGIPGARLTPIHGVNNLVIQKKTNKNIQKSEFNHQNSAANNFIQDSTHQTKCREVVNPNMARRKRRFSILIQKAKSSWMQWMIPNGKCRAGKLLFLEKKSFLLIVTHTDII